jgi:hypothetical protein
MDSDKPDSASLPTASNWRDSSKEELWLEVEKHRQVILSLCRKLRKVAKTCERHSLPWSDEFKLGHILALTEEYLDSIYDD